MSQKIRIKLKSYDHNLVDKSAEKIVRTVKATGAIVSMRFFKGAIPPKASTNISHSPLQNRLSFSLILLYPPSESNKRSVE